MLFVLFVVTPRLRDRSERITAMNALRDAPLERIASAARNFGRDRKTTNGLVAKGVSLQELVSTGYLRGEEYQRFTRSRMVFYRSADDRSPQTVVAACELSDGVVVLLSDGSIQQVTRDRYLEQIARQSGQVSQP